LFFFNSIVQSLSHSIKKRKKEGSGFLRNFLFLEKCLFEQYKYKFDPKFDIMEFT
jgi:hypothetical protein